MTHDYPILEYDADGESILTPRHVVKPMAIPEHCVLCFFNDEINKLQQKGLLKRIKKLKTEKRSRSTSARWRCFIPAWAQRWPRHFCWQSRSAFAEKKSSCWAAKNSSPAAARGCWTAKSLWGRCWCQLPRCGTKARRSTTCRRVAKWRPVPQPWRPSRRR